MTLVYDQQTPVTKTEIDLARRRDDVVGFLRYWYNLTKAEVQLIADSGYDLAIIGEGATGKEHLGGFQAGVSLFNQIDARLDAVGIPESALVWTTADFDLQPPQYEVSGEFMDGANHTSVHPLGAYGPKEWAEWCIANGKAIAGWIMGSTSFSVHYWDNGQCCLRQRVGAVLQEPPATDYNDVLLPYWGQIHLQGDTMPLTKADADLITTAVITALQNDAVTSGLASKDLYWVGGGAAAQGQPVPPGRDLAQLYDVLVEIRDRLPASPQNP
jgi:hypothetical protein